MSQDELDLLDLSSQEIEFYKKRYELVNQEREVLKNENKVLKQELNSMKEFISKISLPKKSDSSGPKSGKGKDEMLSVLELQRKKIESLEQELNLTKLKYEKAVSTNQKNNLNQPESTINVEQEVDPEAALERANDRIQHLEKQLKDLSVSSANEIAVLKKRLAENNAAVILSMNESNKLPDFSRSMSKKNSFAMIPQNYRDSQTPTLDNKKKGEIFIYRDQKPASKTGFK